MIENMCDRLKAGETIHVQTIETKKQFTIKTRKYAGLTGYYIILPDGTLAHGYKGGVILDRETVNDWATRLEEIGGLN